MYFQDQSILENKLVKDELKWGGKGWSEDAGEQTCIYEM